MSVTVLKEVLITAGKLDRYFEGVVPLNLWRACNRKRASSQAQKTGNIFDFVEEETILSNGRPRPADITIETRIGGAKWVSVKNRPRGVSTFDKPGCPKGKDWEYFRIPQGTVLPMGLAIVRDEFNSSFEATHYTIAPAYDMPLEQFKGLLVQLLKHVIKEAA